LHVRRRRLGQNLDGSGAKRGAKGHHALALHKIAQDLVGKAEPAGAFVQGFEVADIAGHARDVMVLEIPADPGQYMPHRDTRLLQHLGLADTRQL
jgi:hypothetical protein